MRMAAHYNLNPGGCWIQVQFMNIMQHIDGRWPGFHHCCCRQFGSPRARVDISLHRNHRRQFFERTENLRLPHVARVNDQIITKSDYDRAEVLVTLLTAKPLDASLRQGYVDAAESLKSTYDQNRVLAALVKAER